MKRYILFIIILMSFFLIAGHENSVFNRIEVNNIYHAYGGFQDSMITLDLTQNEWQQVTNPDSNDLFSGSEVDGFSLVGDTVIVNFTGDFDGVLSISFQGSLQKEYQFRVFNVTQNRQEGFLLPATGNGTSNYVPISLPVYIEATENDSLILQIQNISGNEDIVLRGAQFELIYLHN